MSSGQRFAPSDKVRVHTWRPPGHVRTPFYLRGHAGVVEEVVGRFHNPEELAYGWSGGAPIPLYRVSFAAAELWPDQPVGAHDRLVADIFEHWLEPENRPETG